MCGGNIELNEEKTFGTCEYCGSVMTLPKVNNEQRAARFNRGNHFRRLGDFDKALAVYESIVREDDTDAEAHWCCALCRFGIEYVEDPNTYEFIPTCHRASFDSFTEDIDYLSALENSDGITRRQYQKDAVKIAEVQRGILATSQKEEPYDVFICYKETDEQTKERTRDSLDAQEIYYQLMQAGYRVFFSRITLENKVGAEYEPYIFAALNSANVMVVIGSKPEYFNAVWVKNEWSRFLVMMRKDRSKLILPCYKGMDPYDLPEQLGVLQSYDMSKIGFIQDLIRGIKKVLKKDEEKVSAHMVKTNTTVSEVQPLIKRIFIYLEDGEWDKANEYCERVLDSNPENSEAYIGKLLVEYKSHNLEDLANGVESFSESKNFQKVMRFSEKKTKQKISAALETATENNKIYSEIIICKGNALEQSNDYKELISYICELATINTASYSLNKEIKDKFTYCINLLKQKAYGEFGYIEIKDCFEGLSTLEAVNGNYINDIEETLDYILERFMQITEPSIYDSLDFRVLSEILSCQKTLLKCNKIKSSDITELIERSKNCEEKLLIKEQYERERKALTKELSEIESRITNLHNYLYNSRERGMIIKLEKENTLLLKQINEAGAFKKKQKKEMQNQININNTEIETLEKTISINNDKIRVELNQLKKKREELNRKLMNGKT